MLLESEPVAQMTARDSTVTVLQEIDLGAHHLFIMSDQSIDLMADEQASALRGRQHAQFGCL